MIILGVVLLILGLVLHIQILWIIGLIIACVGAVFLLAGTGGRAGVGGRRYWY